MPFGEETTIRAFLVLAALAFISLLCAINTPQCLALKARAADHVVIAD